MSTRKTAAIMTIAVMAFAACSSGGVATTRPATAAPTAPAAATCNVGTSWFTFQEERYGLRDEPALQKAVRAGGGEYFGANADNSAEQQAADVENLIAQNVDVIVIDALDSEAILPSVAAAKAAGIPVIAYDRLIEDAEVLYLTHDNIEVGRMIARTVLEAAPTGNYALILGDEANPNAIFLQSGFHEIIDPAVESGAVTIKGEQFTDDWKPENAKTNMEQILTEASNDIDAVLSENDGMAGGVIAALTDQGLEGEVKVGGQDGDLAALNRVALGTQLVSVWKDSSELGTAVGNAALQLCEDPDLSKVTGTAPFTTPGGITVTSILLNPIPITQDNLNVVLDAKWITPEALCQGVTPGSVAACP